MVIHSRRLNKRTQRWLKSMRQTSVLYLKKLENTVNHLWCLIIFDYKKIKSYTEEPNHQVHYEQRRVFCTYSQTAFWIAVNMGRMCLFALQQHLPSRNCLHTLATRPGIVLQLEEPRAHWKCKVVTAHRVTLACTQQSEWSENKPLQIITNPPPNRSCWMIM